MESYILLGSLRDPPCKSKLIDRIRTPEESRKNIIAKGKVYD
jgi:hypothetical protein